MIVAGDDKNAAIWRRAISVSVFQRIAGAVDARAFSIPHRKDAIDKSIVFQFDLLRAKDCGSRKIFVDRRQEFDLFLFQEYGGAPHRLIDAAERRSPVAGDKSGRVEVVGAIQAALVQHDRDKRLTAGKEDPAVFPAVPVVKFVIVEADEWGVHGAFPGLGAELSRFWREICGKNCDFICSSDKNEAILAIRRNICFTVDHD
jgi:hypothetical protein